MSKSIAKKLSVIILCMVIVCSCTVGLVSYIFFRNNSITDNAERATDIAQSVAALIQADKFVDVMQTGEKNEHWYDVKAALDEIKVATDVKYLYVLGAEITDDTMTYYAEGYNPVNDVEAEYDFGEKEDTGAYIDELFKALQVGQPQASGLYASGDSGEFGRMVSGFVPIKQGDTVVGVVGVDISVEDVMEEVSQFGLRLILIVAISCLLFGFLSVRFVGRLIGKPIAELTELSEQMAQGSLDVSLSIQREDEIGLLADSFRHMIENSRMQVALMEQLANGDLNVKPQIRSQQDAMNLALEKAADKLNYMFRDILSSASQVSSAANQISMTAQNLASSNSEQAATIDRFSESIASVHSQSNVNTQHSLDAQSSTQQAGALLADSISLMDDMADAMKDISSSSAEISQIIKVIEDIAFQTNILALNAAVEAARAGQHGKGFAVVADEVRNLASKSAQAAKETAALIETSVAKTAIGNSITEKTRVSLHQTNEMAEKTVSAMEQISAASNTQNLSISAINDAVDQISVVVQSNSAAAEQSAAAAEELAAQANMLNEIVSHFRLRDPQ